MAYLRFIKIGILSILAICMLAIPLAVSVNAQEGAQESVLRAVIDGAKNIKVKKGIILNASKSKFVEEGGKLKYHWDLGDGTYIDGEEITHSYKSHGRYIIKLTVEQGKERHTIETVIFVYKKIVVFIVNLSKDQEKILRIVEDVKKSGTLVKLVDTFTPLPEFSTEEILTKRLLENKDSLIEAETIIYWSRRTVDFNIIPAFYRETKDSNVIDYSNKTIVFISEERLENVRPFAQSAYNLLKPKRILITRKEAITPILVAINDQQYLEEMEKRFIETVQIDEESGKWKIWNIFSSITRYMLESGIPSNMIILILMLPIIATTIAFFRQVIGLTTFGVYTPAVIALSFIALTFKFGLLILIITIVSGAVTRVFLSKFRLLYIPKVALIFTASSFVIFLTIAIGAYFNIGAIASLAVFPMLMMMTLGEKFLSIRSGQGFLNALLSTTETVIVSMVCYLMATWEMLQVFVINYPGWMFFLVIIINILLGKFTGLRLKEYFRFRAVFEAIEE